MAVLTGKEELTNTVKKSQVYLATHDGAGNRLPYMYRSFISFTFGGKFIEDFGLLVVTGSDRLERGAYAPFSDLVSTYDTLDGQLYWGSKIEPNQLNLSLATDYITEKQIDDFREWFAPGKERELILAEHPNRAILARVAEPPVLSFIPFEEETEIVINGINYITNTTVYRGEVSLSFIMDEPNWYGKLTYMPSYINKDTLEILNYGEVNSITTIQDKDMLKIMLEDGIPHQSILELGGLATFFLGNNRIVSEEARIGEAQVGIAHIGIFTSETNDGLTIDSSHSQYLFYSGTAPNYPIIKFTMDLSFSNNYISHPTNKIQNTSLLEANYSYISIDDKKFKFTTPSLLTGYNQAIKIFKAITANQTTKVEVLNDIATNVNEYYSRAWAVKCVNAVFGNNSTISGTSDLFTNMRRFFAENSPKVTFIINSKTGEAIGQFYINNASVVTENDYISITQNVGDMVRSDYLTIEGRNQLNSNGEIVAANCKQISSNESLSNVLIYYQNMYL